MVITKYYELNLPFLIVKNCCFSFEPQSMTIVVDRRQVQLTLWDQKEYARLRPLTYSGTVSLQNLFFAFIVLILESHILILILLFL